MVEMKETANILTQLTPRSLVVLDEIGRGTSTFDGISIAWAVAEHLHDAAERPLVLFATHYHELTDLARSKARVRNYSVAVREWKGEVVFLRRIVAGPGEPELRHPGRPARRRARRRSSSAPGQILHNLERNELTDAGQPRLARRRPTPAAPAGAVRRRRRSPARRARRHRRRPPHPRRGAEPPARAGDQRPPGITTEEHRGLCAPLW